MDTKPICLAALFMTIICIALPDNSFSMKLYDDSSTRSNIIISGKHIKAVMVCYDDFIKISDRPDQNKNIEDYYISVSDDYNAYEIIFMPKIPRQEDRSYIKNGGGGGVKYLINDTEYKIFERKFSR